MRLVQEIFWTPVEKSKTSDHEGSGGSTEQALLDISVVPGAFDHAMLWGFFKRSLEAARIEASATSEPFDARTLRPLGIIGVTALACTLGTDLAWTTTTGFVALLLFHRQDSRKIWGSIDWSLLLFIAGLFVVMQGFIKSGAPAWFFSHLPLQSVVGEGGVTAWLKLSGIFVVGSNIVSNVPFILVIHDEMGTLANAHLGWEMLAMASTFAGNLTLLGSVANIIVAESARDIGGIGFLQYLKVGFPLCVVTTLTGVLWLYAVLPL